MSESTVEYLKHILDECNYITSVITYDTEKNEVLENETVKRAMVRSLEIIGEAVKKIPADVKLKWKNIQWKNIAGIRDKLIHDYMGINYSIVWDIVKNRIPELKEQIEIVINQEFK